MIFFPILWTILTSFKTELEAIRVAADSCSSTGRLENYREVQERSDYFQHAHELGHHRRSARRCSALLIAVPAAWAMAFAPTKRTKDILMWMLSTKMMPPVGVLVPIYLIFRRPSACSTPASALIVVLMPRQPADRRLDALHLLQGNPGRDPRGGAHGRRDDLASEFIYVLTPMAVPGIASTLLLNIILAWNEAFWTLNADHRRSGAAHRLHRLLSRAREGLFWAKLSAASTLAIAPILVLGWFSQKQLVRGLTFGAVK